jgi:hypothetical protein
MLAIWVGAAPKTTEASLSSFYFGGVVVLVWCTAVGECTLFTKWQGFGVSGVPQLFGESIIVAGAGAATVFTCELAGRAVTLSASKSELRKGMLSPCGFQRPFIAA